MCGIVGTSGFGDEALVREMAATIQHRGPDGDGFFSGDGVHLGNRRLAVIDPSGGWQPMTNEDGSVVVVYNGEIYNYPELRDLVLARGHILRNHCDTEVVAHLYEDEGLECLSRLNGIFAFALFDRRRRALFVVRDPLGVKPVVYAERDGKLAFASEAKAVLASGLVGAEVDTAGLHLATNVRYIPGNRTLFAGIKRVPPGHVLQADAAGVRVFPYTSIDWTPDETLTEDACIEGIRSHYEAAVRRQLVADVPLGISLSGGIDSSSIVAMARRANTGPLRTFTLGFDEPTDELDDARAVADRFGTEHHELVLTEPVLHYLRDVIRHTEEPKVNALQLYLLHRYIGDHVTVVLSGLGGDELFAGYDFYSYLEKGRRLRALAALGPLLDRAARRLARLDMPSADLYVRGLEWAASSRDAGRHYLLLRNAWDFNAALLDRVYTPAFRDRLATATRQDYDAYFTGGAPVSKEALVAEFSTKMVADLLHNEDTMSMAHGVESRVPLLDLELVRFAARIPDRLRFAGGKKGLLKKALRDVVPDGVLTKKKWGFTFDPVQQYGKDLRPLALEMLTPQRLAAAGIFNPRFVQKVLDAKPHQRMRWHYFMLWQMIGFQMWHELFIDSRDGWSAPAVAPRPRMQANT
jgi:asparagine synthase (glutamine-hydrolysing)